MDAVVPPFENGLGHFSTQPIPNNVVTSSISASNHHHPIDQSVVANEPLTDNNFEDIFESSTTDCTDIYSELPPLNERKIGNTATFNLACYKIIQLSSANYRREEIAKLFKAKESFLVSFKTTEFGSEKNHKIPFLARNAPPHYYAEAKHLERARVENLLKKKIAQRPEKKTLIEVIITCNRVVTDP